MSAQQRYRTLVHHIGRIYAAPEGTRTELLQTGLDQIVSVIGPVNSSAWSVVSADSDRLLKVWVAKERAANEAASTAVAEQLTDMLRELAAASDECPSVACDMSSVLCDKPTPEARPLVLAAVVPTLVVEEVAPPAPSEQKAPVKAEPKAPVKTEPKAPSEPQAPVKTETVSHVEEEEYEVEEEEEEEEEEVVEEEEVIEAEEIEEEEEEVGMEVEQIMIRGRAWWLETNTQKIYAVVDGDDVGDEMGEMVNGKPRFYAVK
jgi:hypothetical protein